MRPRLRVKSLAVLVGLLECCAIALLASCATSRGSTLATVLTTQQGGTPPASPFTPPPQAPAQSPPQSRQGLEISTDPSSVEVWIDGTLKGLSPIILTDIVTGWHRVVLRKTGYHETSAWVDFNSDYMFYQATLTRITGFLQLSVTPGAAAVTLDGGPIDPGLLTLGIGTYTLSARLFGYTEYRAQVTINEAAVTNVAISLSEAPFAVTTFSVPKKTVNPENPGLLGRVEGRFSVTGPGSGEIQVIDGAGATVLSRRLPDFTTWDQSFTWNVHDGNGDALPDGAYTIVLVAVAPGKDTVTRSAVVSVDRTLKIAPRSLWSGSAGLLYAPTTDVLPEGDYQLGILAAGIALSNPDVFQAPAQLGARVGLGSSLELDATVGAIASSAAFPVGASVALRWNMTSPHGDWGTSTALQGKLSAQLVPGVDTVSVLMTDTFADFTGLSVELPLQLQLGRLSLLLTPGVIGSLWYPYSSSTAASPVAWMYLRGGILLDLGSVSAGVSATTRTEPLPGGVAFLGTPVPFQAGAEVHWLVPGTSILVSGIVAGEYEDDSNYYFMGGGGLGFLY